ncbi:MAG: class I SAM-dependent methyltransferase [Flavobacteriaceae bacterium]
MKNELPILECIDHTVSRETFKLIHEVETDMLVTNPQPKIEELEKYYESNDYISHTDSDKTLLDRVYQSAKKYTVKRKIKLLKKIIKNKKELQILDIGAGTGDFLNACKNENWKVVGVEPNKKARVLAKSKLGILKPNTLTYNDFDPKIYDSLNDIETNTKFDIITLWHVLEHVPDLENYIKKLQNLLMEHGTLIIAVPNYKSYDAKHYGKFWAAYDVPRHLWHFSKKTITYLFNKENMVVTKTLPMKLDSYYVSLLSEKYKTGKSNPVKAFFIGLLSNLKAIRTKEYSSLIYLIKNK